MLFHALEEATENARLAIMQLMRWLFKRCLCSERRAQQDDAKK